MEFEERIQRSQADSFRVDMKLEVILVNERHEPDAINNLPTSQRLRLGHYQEARRAYLTIHGKLPSEPKR